jgi:hypothetical protein
MAHAMRWLAASLFSMCFASSAYAVVISDDVFTRNGGNLGNIPGTIAKAMEPQRQDSFSPQFLAVGRISSGCTATWIGDSPDKKSSFFITAAHCVEMMNPTNFWATFTDWAGRDVTPSDGTGSYVLGPYRNPIPPGMGGASSDIAVVTLPKTADILDAKGLPIAPPILYDGSDEMLNTVWFAGYGLWGTGTGDGNESYLPADGYYGRRADGASKISSIFESDFGIGAGFNPTKGGDSWAHTATGDSGSAWWQMHDGAWNIIAVTNGGNVTISTGARVSKYANWIRSIYPQARFSSDGYSVNESQALTTPNFALDAKTGTVAYVVPIQPAAMGPTSMIWAANFKPSIVQVLLQEKSQNRSEVIQLEALRDIGCGPSYFQEMNDAVSCYSNRSGPLIVKYDPKDNKGLPPGTYVGSFSVEARGWHDQSYVRAFRVNVSITVK